MGGHRVQGRNAGVGGRPAGPADGRCPRRRAGGRLRRRDRGRASRRSPPRSPPSCRSRRSASAPGPDCDGQVLVLHDVLGLSDLQFKFAKQLRRPAARPPIDGHRGSTWTRCAAATGPTTSTPSTDARCSASTNRLTMRAWSDAARHAWRRSSGSCRRWARSTTATSRSSTLAANAATTSSCRSSSTRCSSTARTTSTPTRAPIDDDVATLRTRWASTPSTRRRRRRCTRAGFQTHVEPGPLGRDDGGSGPTRPLPRRDDRRHEAVRRRPPGRRGVRREGLPAAGDHPPDGGGPRPRDSRSSAAPIVREPDGLAMSSRNIRLVTRPTGSPHDVSRRRSQRWPMPPPAASGTSRGCSAAARDVIGGEPRARLDYVSVFDPATLEPLEHLDGPARVAIAVWFGDVRLIDNRAL